MEGLKFLTDRYDTHRPNLCTRCAGRACSSGRSTIKRCATLEYGQLFGVSTRNLSRADGKLAEQKAAMRWSVNAIATTERRWLEPERASSRLVAQAQEWQDLVCAVREAETGTD